MLRKLTAEQLEAYRQEGVLAPVPVLSPEEVARYRDAVENLEQRLGGNPKPVAMSQPHLFFRWAYELATHPWVLDVVEDLLGPNILVHSTSIFSKHPRTQDFVSWHQDGFYWEMDPPLLTSAWIALTDSTVENGCLRVIPGSHNWNRVAHTSTPMMANNLLSAGLEVAVEVDESRARDLLLKAGELSLHHVHMVHGSNPNRSVGKRTGFAIRYVAPEVRQALPHHQVLLARGRDTHSHYRVLTEHPAYNTMDEALEAQSEFARQILRDRLGR
jgi:non-heme Fe2+,alpha-ketoglutarate-dependent halogenase